MIWIWIIKGYPHPADLKVRINAYSSNTSLAVKDYKNLLNNCIFLFPNPCGNSLASIKETQCKK